MSLELKESDSINIFKEKLKRLYGPNKSIKLYSHGHGWHTVNHCRLRLGLSHLKHHLFRYNIIQSAHCENVTCDNLPETSSHFLLYCPRYEPQRRSMLKEISKIIFPGTSYITVIALMSDHLCNILLHGSEDLSLEENKKVFDYVFKFTWCLMIVVWLFLSVSWVCQQFVIVILTIFGCHSCEQRWLWPHLLGLV